MKIIRTLGFAAAIIGLASWFNARGVRQRARRRERETLDRTRWEGEGGATSHGAQVSETRGPATDAPRLDRAAANSVG